MKWFPRFPKIRSKPSETPSLPFNSSLQEVGHLKALRAQPGWVHLQTLLERVAQAEYDRLAMALPYEEYLAQCGAYQASRRAVDLVDTLIEKAELAHGHKRDTDDHRRDHAKSIFFGSPNWK
jgi:hypothetical protein